MHGDEYVLQVLHGKCLRCRLVPVEQPSQSQQDYANKLRDLQSACKDSQWVCIAALTSGGSSGLGIMREPAVSPIPRSHVGYQACINCHCVTRSSACTIVSVSTSKHTACVENKHRAHTLEKLASSAIVSLYLSRFNAVTAARATCDQRGARLCQLTFGSPPAAIRTLPPALAPACNGTNALAPVQQHSATRPVALIVTQV